MTMKPRFPPKDSQASSGGTLANVVDAHADSLGVEGEGVLPGRAGLTALAVGLDLREGRPRSTLERTSA
jgi:hypothetical protein